jgi:hypothetical protein
MATDTETRHAIHYSVDGVSQESTDARLTVREILTRAGLDPANHYLVEIKGAHQVNHTNLDEELHLHEKQEFISVFTGPTPLS